MWHIGILAQPIGRNDLIPVIVIGMTLIRDILVMCRTPDLLHVQDFAILIVWLHLIRDEEIDTGSQEVDGRSLEELVTTATASLLLAFLEGFKQRLGSL